MNWGRKWLVSNVGKTKLALIDRSNNSGVTDEKMNWSVLDQKSPFKMMRLSNWIGALILSLFLKIFLRKL